MFNIHTVLRSTAADNTPPIGALKTSIAQFNESAALLAPCFEALHENNLSTSNAKKFTALVRSSSQYIENLLFGAGLNVQDENQPPTYYVLDDEHKLRFLIALLTHIKPSEAELHDRMTKALKSKSYHLKKLLDKFLLTDLLPLLKACIQAQAPLVFKLLVARLNHIEPDTNKLCAAIKKEITRASIDEIITNFVSLAYNANLNKQEIETFASLFDASAIKELRRCISKPEIFIKALPCITLEQLLIDLIRYPAKQDNEKFIAIKDHFLQIDPNYTLAGIGRVVDAQSPDRAKGVTHFRDRARELNLTLKPPVAPSTPNRVNTFAFSSPTNFIGDLGLLSLPPKKEAASPRFTRNVALTPPASPANSVQLHANSPSFFNPRARSSSYTKLPFIESPNSSGSRARSHSFNSPSTTFMTNLNNEISSPQARR